MIKAAIILTGLLTAVAVGFFGVVRMRFAIGLVLACMALNLFGCSTAHASSNATFVANPLWGKTIDCTAAGYDTVTHECVKPTKIPPASSTDASQISTVICPKDYFLTSKGMCVRPPPLAFAKLVLGNATDGTVTCSPLRFSLTETLAMFVCAGVLGFALGKIRS